jgi:hypothetical protein
VRLGLTDHEAAVLLGTDERLIRRWASDKKEIPQSITDCLMWTFLCLESLSKIDIPLGAGMYFPTSKFNHWRTEAIGLLHNGKEVPEFRPEILPADWLPPVAR